jgi:hypothetical protein
MSTSPSQLTAVAAAAADLIEVSRLSATIVYTASTISAQASDNSLNDAAAQFVIENLANGMRIQIAGFTGDVGNNFDSAEIVSVAAGKVILGSDTLLTDDAAGESVTITAWESKRTTAQEVADLAAPGGGGDPSEAMAFSWMGF